MIKAFICDENYILYKSWIPFNINVKKKDNHVKAALCVII